MFVRGKGKINSCGDQEKGWDRSLHNKIQWNNEYLFIFL